MGLFNKKELKRIQELEHQNIILQENLDKIGAKKLFEIEEMIEKSKDQLNELNNQVQQLIKKNDDLNLEIKEKENQIKELDFDFEMIDFGVYTPRYNCMSSGEYADKIKENREKQKQRIKSKTALFYSDNWTLDGSKSKGRALNNSNMKMVLRSFNNECDVLISKVKFNNVEKIEERIWKAAKQIDKLNTRNQISIRNEYIQLKIDELHLVHEYALKKQEEKEMLREQRELEREEKRLQKEIADARKAIIKEQMHYNNALEKLLSQLSTANDNEKLDIENKIKDLKEKLNEIDKSIKEIDYREANKRAGYVYVISNIGSFGENIYKIGMTRRLDPQDRVDELGDASVPFKFDVHAMIFSEDAPKLESALHKAFENNKVNMMNGRKEFFNVSLEEIEKIVKENHEKVIEFNRSADAEQYRESLKIKETLNK